jgi:hypothetical protein
MKHDFFAAMDSRLRGNDGLMVKIKSSRSKNRDIR